MSARDRHIANDELSAYLDGAVEDDVRWAIDDHLATCAACRAELAELRATVQLLRSLPVPTRPRSFQLGPEHARPSPPRGLILTVLPVARALAVAAAIALLVVSGAFLFDSTSTERTGSIVFSESTTAATGSAADAAAPPPEAAGAGGEPGPTASAPETNTSMAAAEADEPPPTDVADADNAMEEADESAQPESAPPAESGPAPAADSPAQEQAPSSREAMGISGGGGDEADIPWGPITAWLAAATVALGGLWATLSRIARSRPRRGT